MKTSDVSYYAVRCTGRDPDNPSNRKRGAHLVQRLEIIPDGRTQTLTGVLKDNWILEVRYYE